MSRQEPFSVFWIEKKKAPFGNKSQFLIRRWSFRLVLIYAMNCTHARGFSERSSVKVVTCDLKNAKRSYSGKCAKDCVITIGWVHIGECITNQYLIQYKLVLFFYYF